MLGGGANYELREESNDMSDPNSWIWNLGDKVFELGDTNKTIAQRAKAELETKLEASSNYDAQLAAIILVKTLGTDKSEFYRWDPISPHVQDLLIKIGPPAVAPLIRELRALEHLEELKLAPTDDGFLREISYEPSQQRCSTFYRGLAPLKLWKQ